MGRLFVAILTVVIVLTLSACGPKPKEPVTGADLVATAVAAHYEVKVDDVKKVDGQYEWTVSAVNGSEYGWKGTFYVKLVNAENEIVESHDFKIDEMAAPGEKTAGLKFTSAHAPSEEGGDVASLKAEVDVTDYKEPSGGASR